MNSVHVFALKTKISGYDSLFFYEPGSPFCLPKEKIDATNTSSDIFLQKFKSKYYDIEIIKEKEITMGRRDKSYSKTLKEQAYEKLVGMQAFGESKEDAIRNGTDKEKIFSFSTYKTYWKHCKYFLEYIHQAHPEITTLKKARPYISEWLQIRVDQGLSAWTVHTEAKALGKLYGITPEDPDYFVAPKRERANIKRSRTEAVRDKHFSVTNNSELIKFCRGVGARRAGLQRLKGKDLMTMEQIKYEVTTLSKEGLLTSAESSRLSILKDAMLFEDCHYFVYLKEKGGRERISPIVGPDKDVIVKRFQYKAPDEKVWQHIHSAADIHGYRADYAGEIYRMYARKIEEIPYDRINKGTGRRYQSEVYTCRKDEAKKKLDKKAMYLDSKALGHNRPEIVANNYLRGI